MCQTLATEAIEALVDQGFRQYPKGLVAHVHKGQVPSQAQTLASYVVSPPISIRRIDHDDGQWVTYHYRSHRTDRTEHETVDELTFILLAG